MSEWSQSASYDGVVAIPPTISLFRYVDSCCGIALMTFNASTMVSYGVIGDSVDFLMLLPVPYLFDGLIRGLPGQFLLPGY